MFENYKVAVKISLVNHVSAGLLTLTKQFAQTDAAAAAFQKRMTAIQETARKGVYLFGGGMALAAPFIYAIDKAAELQKQMLAIQIATRGSTDEMNKMRSAIEGIASKTVFSNIDVAKMGKLVATGTGLGARDVKALLPEYAKFADVQMLMKGTSYEESVKDAIRLAHTAQHYDPQSLGKYLDLLTKASLIVPGGLGEVGHALKYSQGMGKTALGIDDENMVLLTALLNRLGFAGSRGGTNLIAAMSRTIPGVFGSGLLTGKSGEALRAMDMVDSHGHSRFFKNGKFDAFLWMKGMAEYVQREFTRNPEAIARQHIMKNFQHSFGTQGARVASLLSDPKALEQFKLIGEAFANYSGVDEMQQKFANDSVAQQWMNAKTNFVSAMTELGITLLPMASKMLKKLNTHLGALITWITDNPEVVKHLAYAFLGLGAAMMFGGSVMLLTSAFKGLAFALSVGTGLGSLLMGASSGVSALTTAIGIGTTGLVATLGYVAVGLGAIAAAAGVFYVAYKAWDAWNHPEDHPLIQILQNGNAGAAYSGNTVIGKIKGAHPKTPIIGRKTLSQFYGVNDNSSGSITTDKPTIINNHIYIDGKEITNHMLGPNNQISSTGMNPSASRPMPGTPALGY